ncbi:endonuclease MutS2 [Candidatus Atribacteria bacterium HGW-Atribacteria-1]|nr:MAG: endonuclease MutS2 [Candidatus Atribacteria bacterium HGW-Atribacteria-1]
MRYILDEHTFSVLEFSKIKNQLKEKISTAIGELIVENITPKINLQQIFNTQRETTEMREIISYDGTPPFSRLEDISSELKRSAVKGSILDAKKIIKILKVLKTSRLIKKFLLKTKEKYPLIKERAEKIRTFSELEKEIIQCIDEDGVVLDRASPELRKIRRDIINKEQALKNKLETLIRSSRFAAIIQEPLITVRQNRYVIPVKQEKKAKFPGIVHDKSDSGATLFIEPFIVVELNNLLRQLIKDEEQEILKILQRITSLIGERAQEINDSVLSLGEIDFIYARAVLADKMKAVEPKLNQNGFINLIQARHPLLQGPVVPININLGKAFNILVITGPNTGGKTVTLKTVGILTLMAQCGLHIPAAEGSEVPVFKKIFCDIGDEQSIEQNLSTFSSHMKYIVQILREADSESLVLLDELGAGTDPTEGAALGMAVLDFLRKKETNIIATTHHDSLKTYAYLTKGVCNARVEFDEETLKPTFEISIGLPGKSCAFIIAQKLGLATEVVSRAQSFLSQEKIKADNLIEKIEKDRKLIEKEKNLIEVAKEESIEIRDKLEKELNKIEENKKEIILKTYWEAEKILKETQNRAEKIIEKLNKKKVLSKESKGPLLEQMQAISKEIQDEIVKIKPEKELIKNQNIEIGDYVLVKSLNKKGIILSYSTKSEKCKIQIDNMKMLVSIFDIEKVDKLGKAPEKYSHIGNGFDRGLSGRDSFSLSKIKTFRNEISIRQLTIEEVQPVLEKYLDDAYLLGISPVYIIHGKGKGILREEVKKLLNEISFIKSFRLGDVKEGGMGVTVVYLEK